MMNPRYFLYTLFLCMASTLVTSCEHRELTDPTDAHYIRVYMEEEIKNVTCGFYNESYEHPEYRRPLSMLACLADANTGEIIREGLLKNQGNDERGYYIDGYIGAPDGKYNLLIYQMGSPVTLINQTNDYYSINAYTKHVSERVLSYLTQTSKVLGSDRIMQEPEHIMVGRCNNISIKASRGTDTLRNADGDYFTAKSIAKSYYLQLRITGVQWIRSAAAVLSGMAGSSLMCKEDGMNEDDPVNLYFPMLYSGKVQRVTDEKSVEVLYATFTTFGKIPDITSELTLNFEFSKSDGTTQVETVDLTETFKTPLAIENQWLLLDKQISISKPIGTGGMDPEVDGWKDLEADLPM